jgi:hypothetical protein
MKNFSLVLLMMLSFGVARSQSIIVYVTEKIKGAEIPVIRTDFDVVVNDSLKKKGTSQADGSLPRIGLYNGTHKITLKSDEFNDVTENDILIKDFRTTEVTVYVSRKSQPKTEGKK